MLDCISGNHFVPSGRFLRSSQLNSIKTKFLPGLFSCGGTNVITGTNASCNAFMSTSSASNIGLTAKNRLDYNAPKYGISDTNLTFSLQNDHVIVRSVLCMTGSSNLVDDLVLDGENLQLLSIELNSRKLSNELGEFIVGTDSLTIPSSVLRKYSALSPDNFRIATEVKIFPVLNTQLSGLYQSRSILCTQCEAEGFRRITYFLDRPDVMSAFSVRIEADKQKYPTLLSNGNRFESGTVANDPSRHFVIWKDPFLKPSYLFALVAGEFSSIKDSFMTKQHKNINLEIFSSEQNVTKLDHAMESLKLAMKWDEDVFGLSCDVTDYSIVAVDDFNMGAMENKGLNVFNSSCVVADEKTSTDAGFERVQTVVAHEYFHNWTGNRVTVRDWFQLTLKEGLTVFRDQTFSMDIGSSAVKRIDDVRNLISVQFEEDSGPLSHPIRPDSVVTIDNFYTSTVYQKGAEIIRMYATILGREGFLKGMKLYIQRHDGQAVTCEDFRLAMQDANNVDLTQFERWYSTRGTPVVSISIPNGAYDAIKKQFSFQMTQSSKCKDPLHIPVQVGLISSDGKNLLPTESSCCNLTQNSHAFTFNNITSQPVLSVNRGFSAPVIINHKRPESELRCLMRHDSDSYQQYDASSKLLTLRIKSLYHSMSGDDYSHSDVDFDQMLVAGASLCDSSSLMDDALIESFRHVLHTAIDSIERNAEFDLGLTACFLRLPDVSKTFGQTSDDDGFYNPLILRAAEISVKSSLAIKLHAELARIYQLLNHPVAAGDVSTRTISRRRLKNACLDYLTKIGIARHCVDQFHASVGRNLTDMSSALSSLSQNKMHATVFNELLPIVALGTDLLMDHYFRLVCGSQNTTMSMVDEIMKHDQEFVRNNKVPNRVRSVLEPFSGNTSQFHHVDGGGYDLLLNQVLRIDEYNPQLSARLVRPLTNNWRKFDVPRRCQIQGKLEYVLQKKNISKNLNEIMRKSIKEE